MNPFAIRQEDSDSTKKVSISYNQFMTDKRELRQKFRRKRSTTDDLEPFIQHHVKAILSRVGSGTVGLYWPLAGEVNLLNLCQGLEAQVALPKADGRGHLDYLAWCGTDLEPDGCRIPAPATGHPLQPNQLSLLMIPALAVDAQGYRLGYGGGYYDRLRADPAWAQVPAWAVLPSCCLSTAPLPTDDWDIPVHGWVTELGPGKP